MQYRNTPDRDTGRSPAQVLFCRKLRDAVPTSPKDWQIRPEWALTREARELVLARRHEVRGRQLQEHTKELGPLRVGTVVQVQNQAGPKRTNGTCLVQWWRCSPTTHTTSGWTGREG